MTVFQRSRLAASAAAGNRARRVSESVEMSAAATMRPPEAMAIRWRSCVLSRGSVISKSAPPTSIEAVADAESRVATTRFSGDAIDTRAGRAISGFECAIGGSAHGRRPQLFHPAVRRRHPDIDSRVADRLERGVSNNDPERQRIAGCRGRRKRQLNGITGGQAPAIGRPGARTSRRCGPRLAGACASATTPRP